MLLAIDAGNTNTTFAVFDGDHLVADWRVRTVARRTEDEYSVLISGLCERDGVDRKSIDGVAICSVVPATIFPLTKFAQVFLHIPEPFVLTANQAGIDVCYSPQSDVGADRVANAVGAFAEYGGPVVVVDFGTATTFDVVGDDGAYLGGAISPGIDISVEALVTRASQLRRVRYVRPDSVVGTTTVESLQSGIVYGFAGQVDGIVEHISKELGKTPRVIATGGLANLIAAETKSIEKVDQLLTLNGLRIIYARTQSSK